MTKATQTEAIIMAVKRVRLEICYATAILRTYIHNPDIQGIMQNLQCAIDDADSLLTKLNERGITP